MGWLQQHERSGTLAEAVSPANVLAADGTGSPVQTPSRTEWWGVYFRGEKVGWGNQTVSPAPDGTPGHQSRSESWFRLKLMDVTREVRMAEASRFGADWSLESIHFTLKATDVDMSLTARVEPSRIAVKIRTGSSEQSLDIARAEGDGPVYTPSALAPYLKATGIRTGETHRLWVFDPTTQSRQQLVAEIGGEETVEALGTLIPAFRIRTTMLGLSTDTWVNSDGDTIREETQDGFVIIREDEASAKGGVSRNPSDMAEQLAVNIGKPLKNQERLEKLVLKLSGAELDGFDLDGDRQLFSGQILTVVKEQVPAEAGYALPYRGDDGEITRFLQPEPMVASDHPKIIARAREILGGEKNPLVAARKLSDWVYRNVDKQPVFSLPNALEVLGQLKGDCNEHTVLLTALARAAGIPTRQQAGLMHLEGSGRFYYHAWVAFYLGGRWVPADAVFNQFPADVAHLRFINGGADRQTQISRLIGRLRLELVEAR